MEGCGPVSVEPSKCCGVPDHIHVSEGAGEEACREEVRARKKKKKKRKKNGFAGLLNVFPYRGGSRRCLAVPLDVRTTLTAPKERAMSV